MTLELELRIRARLASYSEACGLTGGWVEVVMARAGVRVRGVRRARPPASLVANLGGVPSAGWSTDLEGRGLTHQSERRILVMFVRLFCQSRRATVVRFAVGDGPWTVCDVT